jgi:hypothetical protein
MLWRPKNIDGLEEVERTCFGTPMGRDNCDLAPDMTPGEKGRTKGIRTEKGREY